MISNLIDMLLGRGRGSYILYMHIYKTNPCMIRLINISHFSDKPVPIFSDVRFSYLALVQDKKSTCVLPINACCTVMSTAPPILHAFLF
jgi:hypothetical protein